MTLKYLATILLVHLKRLEADPVYNARRIFEDGKWKSAEARTEGCRRIFEPNVWRAGSYLGVRYITYQGNHFLRKTEALRYLAWLDAGNKGTHLDVPAGY